MHLSIVDDGAVGIYQFKKVHVAGTEGKGRGIVELALYAHGMGCLNYVGDAHFLSEFHRYGVDTLCEGSLEWNRVACEIAVGIGGTPVHFLLLLCVIYLHAYELVGAAVARSESLVHSLCIDEELEG